MAVTIDSLELKIQHDSASAVKGIDSLVRALRRLKTAAGMGAELTEVAKAIRIIKNATQSSNIGTGMAKAMKEIKTATNDATLAADAHVRSWEHYRDVMERIKDMKIDDMTGASPNAENYSKEWDIWGNSPNTDSVSYGNQVQEFVNNYKTVAEKAAEAKEQMKAQKAEEKAITEEANRRHKVEDQIVKDYEKQQANAQRVQQKEAKQAYKDSVKKQTEDIKNANKEYAQVMSMFSKFGGIAMKLGGKIMSAITAPFKKAFEGYKRLVSMVKRMILRRIIMAALKVITDGFKTGLENLYQYSYALNGLDSSRAYQNLDALATAAMYVKNSVGAAAMPVINMFIPVLQRLASWAAMAANAINQLVSALSGKSTFTRAKEYAVDYMDGVKDAAGGANKAAKDLRATLLGFDEINRLDAADKGSGSGGGSGGSSKLDYSNMFEEVKIDKDIASFIDEVKKKIEAGDWSGVGKLIGNKLNEAISKIDTKSIGKKITTKISNGASAVAGLLEATDFKQIGSKIEDFIDGAIEGIDAKAFADAVSGVITGALDLFVGFVMNAKDNGTAAKLAIELKEFIKKALYNLRDYLNTEDWFAVGNALFDEFQSFVENFDAEDIGKSLWTTIGSAWAATATVSYTFAARGIMEFLKEFLHEMADQTEGKPFIAKLAIIGGTILWNLTLGFTFNISKWLWTNCALPFLRGLAENFNGSEAATKYREGAGKIIAGLLKGISLVLGNMTATIGAFGVAIVKRIIGEDAFQKAFNLGKKILSKVKEGMLEFFKGTPFEGVATKLINAFFKPIEKVVGNIDTGLGDVIKKMNKIGNSSITIKTNGSSVSKANGFLPGYYTQMKAEGGYVGAGQLFIANEAGPELVGTVNGRTAVAPNAEITGIANAVYATGEREVAAINNLIRALNAKDMTAVVTADSIVAGLARKNRRDGVSTVPVSV